MAIIQCSDYNDKNILEAIEKAITLCCLDNIIDTSKRILIKPNILSARPPQDAVTTHPSLVEAACKIASRECAYVCAGDSPPFAGDSDTKYKKHCDATGIPDAVNKASADFIRIETDFLDISDDTCKMFKSFKICKPVIDCDLIINLPKLKTHGLTTMSGAIKNIFGCIPGVHKGIFHAQAGENREIFAQMLVDLLKVIKPGINIMDAIICMEGEGPNMGNPRHLGAILVSADPVALDAVACDIMGIDPFSVDMIRLAHEQNLGCGDLSKIEILGSPINSIKVCDFKLSSGKNAWDKIPKPLRGILKSQLTASPIIKAANCIGCGDCSRVCPVNAITPGKPPVIDKKKCISCYCCHEVCNSSAIELRRGLIGKLALRGT